MAVFSLTIFLSAFLLFQVQPLIGKYILPWFGGTPGVWTTCLLFFQVVLLGGYAYAHLIVSRLSSRSQARLHLALMILAAATLPIGPSAAWKPTGDENPLWRILGLLTVSVGAPYLLLSATGPLLQGWFSRLYPGRSPYRLYSLSNIGSLLALLSYPFVFERVLRLQAQAVSWSCGYGLFVLCCGACAVRLMRENPPPPEPVVEPEGSRPLWSIVARRPAPQVVLLWLCLAACGSAMLLATTNQICQDVAVVPFLWVLPLSLYLVSFIICFDRDTWYQRQAWATILVVALALEYWVLQKGANLGLGRQIAVYSFAMFVCCMVCHGELVHLKPDPRHLTLFYLMVSLGGAIGGILIAVAAPRLFTGFWELHLGLMATCLLVLVVAGREWWIKNRVGALAEQSSGSRMISVATGLSALMGWGLLVYLLVEDIGDTKRFEVTSVRNFYGVLRVLDETADEPEQHKLVMCHGRTRHGFQYVAAEKRSLPTSYFGPTSGIGYALRHHPDRAERPLAIGIVGLGTGTIAAHARAGDSITYYEINPMVKTLDDQYFTYLTDAQDRGATVDVRLGDARIVLEREAAGNAVAPLDVLAVDAFSSDAIPVHLLTRECAELYWRHLKPDGILAMHITNLYLNLTPVVRKLAELHGKQALFFKVDGDAESGISTNRWVLVTSNPRFLGDEAVTAGFTPWTDDDPAPLLWTDDFSNLAQVLKR